MLPIVLLGHICTGHDNFPPRPNIAASPNFLVKGRGVHRQGDAWGVHCRTVLPFDCHMSTMGSCGSLFLANGKPIARIGEPVNCGSFTAQGEGSVVTG